MKLPSCVGETDQLLPGGPGSIKSHYDLLWDSLVAQKVKLCPQCRRPGFDPWVGKIPWRRKWQPTPVLLPGESHGQRSLVGYSPRGCRVGHNWATSLTDSLTPMDRSSKQKINKETQVLNDTLDEMDLIDIFRTLHPNLEEYTSFQVHMEHSPG